MKSTFLRIAIFIAFLFTTVFTTPAYADEGTSTPEPVASETIAAPAPEVVASPVPERIDPAIASLSDEEQNGKFCKPPKPDCEYGEDDHGKCKPEPTKTATATKTEHPTQTSTRTPRPTSTPTQPSVTPTNSSTPTSTATNTPTATITTTVTPGCNANNPENCPSPTPICGNGEHTGNPHCQTETSTATATNTPMTSTPTLTSTPTIVPTTTGTPESTITATPTITATVTSTSTPTLEPSPTNTVVPTETPIVVPTETVAPTVTPAPTLTPVTTPTTQVVEENGAHNKNQAKPAKAACTGHDRVVFSIGNTDTSGIWIYNPELTEGFMATNGVNGWNDAPSFDPNNPCIRFVYNHFGAIDGTGELWMWNGSNQPIKDASGSNIEGTSPDWGSNNKIAYIHNGRILTVNPDGSGQFDTGLYGSQPEWSWDAKALSFINDKGELTLVRTDDWTHIGGMDQSPYGAAIWSPDQTLVCDYDWRNECLLLTDNFTSMTAPYIGFSYEPRGDKVLVVVDDQHLEIRDDGPGFALSENQSFGIVTDWFTLDKAPRIAIPGTE